MQAGECAIDVDCYKRGIYLKCVRAKCVKSDHKICLTDGDCKKNFFHKKCRNNHCQLIISLWEFKIEGFFDSLC
jgi:hypothetical protein